MVVAQDAQPTAPAPTPAPSAGASLTVDQMRTQSAEIVGGHEAIYRELLHLKEQAKKQKDVIRLNCVNDKLVQLKAQIAISENTNSELQASLDANREDRFSLWTRLNDENANIMRLRDEGRACIGETELYKQESGIDVQRPDIVDDPGTIDPYNPDTVVVIEPPGYASPYN